MIKNLFFAIGFAFISLTIFSCGEGTTETTDGIDGSNNGFESPGVADVFVNSCATAGCHSGINPAGDISMENYSSLIKGAVRSNQGQNAEFEGEVLIPFNSAKSLIYQMIEGNVSPISPHENLNLSSEQKSRIKNWIDNGAKNNLGDVPFSNPTYRVYVCNQSSDIVSVIDGDFKVVSRIVDVSATPSTDSPHMIKEFGDYYYVTLISAGKFLKIRKSDNQIVGELNGIEKAGMIQITSDGSTAFVSRSSTSPSIYNSVYAIKLSDMSLLQEITLPITGVPHGIALTPNDSILYVANLTKDRISKVNARTLEFIDDIILPSGTEPMQANCSPDGNYIYISSRGTNKLLVLSTQSDSIISEIDVNTAPMHIAVSSDGNKIFVATMGNHLTSNHGNVEVIEKSGESWTKLTTITDQRFSMPHGCDISADNNYLYVSSRNTSGMFTPKFKVNGEGTNGNLAIIDTRTNTVIKVLELEEFPSGLVVEK